MIAQILAPGSNPETFPPSASAPSSRQADVHLAELQTPVIESDKLIFDDRILSADPLDSRFPTQREQLNPLQSWPEMLRMPLIMPTILCRDALL
jgi:hypothetical protein